MVIGEQHCGIEFHNEVFCAQGHSLGRENVEREYGDESISG
jgi:hypothetical protein